MTTAPVREERAGRPDQQYRMYKSAGHWSGVLLHESKEELTGLVPELGLAGLCWVQGSGSTYGTRRSSACADVYGDGRPQLLCWRARLLLHAAGWGAPGARSPASRRSQVMHRTD